MSTRHYASRFANSRGDQGRTMRCDRCQMVVQTFRKQANERCTRVLAITGKTVTRCPGILYVVDLTTNNLLDDDSIFATCLAVEAIASCWGDCLDQGTSATDRAMVRLEELASQLAATHRTLADEIWSHVRGWRAGHLGRREMAGWLDQLAVTTDRRQGVA